MRPVLLLAAALLVSSFAGCVGLPGHDGDADRGAPAIDPLWSVLALPFGGDHVHEDRAAHRGLSTPNFERIAHDPLISAHYGTTAGGYLCGDAASTQDGRRIAAVESRSDVGFALADVTDPAAPRWLGELVMETTYVYDLAVVPDGRHVVLVTAQAQPENAFPSLAASHAAGASGLTWRRPCDAAARPVAFAAAASDPAPRPMSVLLVSIEDPAEPVIVDHHPLAGNGHSAFSTIIDGRTWLVVTTTRVPAPLPLPQTNEMSFFEFYEIVPGPTGSGRLSLLSVYKPPPSEDSGQVLGPRGHDAWLAVHPGTGRTLAYLVGHDRFTVLDLTDPSDPRTIGRWSEAGPGREGFSGALHSALPMTELWDGRHYTIIGPEFGDHPDAHPSGIVWVLDTTDPADPFEVAAWTLPHEVEWSGTYMFSNHYYTVVGRTLLISMYHGGVWAVDLTPVGTAPFVQLLSTGVFLPDVDPATAPAVEVRWAPTVEEVLSFDDGTLLTFDSNSGLYTFRFDATRPAPSPEPWPVEAVG